MPDQNYIYRKTVDWSLLVEGITLPVVNAVVFGQIMGRFLQRGEHKNIHLILNGKTYDARIYNVNFDPRFNRINDILQIRYAKNGELAQALQACFPNSYNFIRQARLRRADEDRTPIRLPEEQMEYLAIYTTEYDDTYIFEPLCVDDLQAAKLAFAGQSERAIEMDFNTGYEDQMEDERVLKIRRLNFRIAENLKLLYEYRCQICGRIVGREYDCHCAEAHHIDYFIDSMNSDSKNQMILCPEHHSIIHDANPVFDRRKLVFNYDNGFTEGLMFNKHL